MRKVLTYNSTTFANWLVALALVLVPFHAFLTVWGSALLGHYTLFRLWDEVLLLVLIGIIAVWIGREKPLRAWLFGNLLVRLILAYGLLTVLLGVISYLKGDVTPKALAYGLLSNLRYLVWFVAVAVVARHSGVLEKRWLKLLLLPVAIVVLFAVLQYTVLPHDFLSHFGYNAQTTIAPIETINHNSHYIRVQSTLRGANPLGAYLVLALGVVATIFAWRKRGRVAYGVFGLLVLGALYASGSRSAWIGAALALAVIGFLRLQSRRGKVVFGCVTLAVLVVLAGLFLAFRNNTGLENALLHTQKHSAVTTSSNSAHASALKTGLKEVVQQPFGDGPGTAGPASEYNGSHGARIAENYYVQIAQETGWLGLGLFLSILIIVGIELYRRARVSPLALTLFAALIGLSFVNMLSHAWSDDTLAYVWWGLAGIALARPKVAGGEV